MQRVLATIAKAQGGHAINNLARAFNLTPEDAQAVLEAVLPRFAAAVEKNTLSRGGLSELVNALGQGHHAVYLENVEALGHPQTVAEGNAILGHIFGTKDASRGVANAVARQTGVDDGVIRAMLPTIATWMMAGMARDTMLGFGDILGRMGIPMPGDFGSGAGGSVRMPELPDVPADIAGAGRGGSMPSGAPPQSYPPRNGGRDGPFGGSTGGWGDDQPAPPPQRPPQTFPRPAPGDRRGGGMGGGFPMPDLPGTGGSGNNPYGDLADILRRGLGIPGGNGGGGMPQPRQAPAPGGGGGFPFPMPQGGPQGGGGGLPLPLPQGQVGGSMLWNIVRTILGRSLGFQNRGVMGWLINLLIMRFGWPLLRTILGRVLTGGR